VRFSVLIVFEPLDVFLQCVFDRLSIVVAQLASETFRVFDAVACRVCVGFEIVASDDSVPRLAVSVSESVCTYRLFLAKQKT